MVRTLKFQPPEPGKDIYLNIDIRLQLKAQELLAGRRGAIVMMDPNTGAILAMESSPSYDPNLFVTGISNTNYSALLNDPARPLVNRTTQGIYAPASTVKPMMAVMGLNEGAITANYRYFGGPSFSIPGTTKKFRDWRKWGHGWLDVYRAIEVSADTYFYDLAYRVGIDKIHSYMTKFGFGQYSGVDLYEETRGVMPSRDWKMARWRQPWYQGDTISIGIGQGYWSSTPIQLAKATSILTQNGHDVTPHLLKSTASQEGVVNAPVNPNIALQAKSDSYWQVARDGMWRVINGHEGTGRRAFANTPYKAAGKSGTAQVVGMKENQVYNASTMKVEHRDNALFVAFAPFDAPKAVVALVLENAGGGSSMAAPVARQMLDAYLVPPEPQLPPAPKPLSPPSEVVPNE